MTFLERYLAIGRRAGCPPDQLQNLHRAGIVLQERQLAAAAAARLCDLPDGPTAVGYGGARGGGKSHWLLAQMGVDDCQRVPGLKCLLLRKVGKANMEHFEDLRQRLFANLPHEFSAYRGILTFANGSRIIAGHFQAEKDIDAYLGLEYDVIGIEEATTLSNRKYRDISTCCRTSKPNWRPRIYSTTNPGGIGHAWYKAKFITPHLHPVGMRSTASPSSPGRDGCPQPSAPANVAPPSSIVNRPSAISPDPSHPSPPVPTLNHSSAVALAKADQPSTLNSFPDTIFIPARVSDNAYNNPEYRKVLESLSGWQRRAWLEGDWDLAAGQFFTTFRRDVHILEDFDETRAREWFMAMDYGFAHYTVFLLGCTDGDGNLFVVDEHAERLWLPQRHAAAVKAMLGRHGLRLDDLQRFVAGSDVFSRQSDGTTIAGQYAREGIYLRAANMDRINGWAEVLHRLGDPAPSGPPSINTGLQPGEHPPIAVPAVSTAFPSGPSTMGSRTSANQLPVRRSASDEGGSTPVRPTLFIHRRCGRLAETLPGLQRDPNRPEDVLKVDADEDGVGGDDSADCLRYLVATKERRIIEMRLRGL